MVELKTFKTKNKFYITNQSKTLDPNTCFFIIITYYNLIPLPITDVYVLFDRLNKFIKSFT